MGRHLGSSRSLVCTDKRGKDAVLLAEQLLWLVELKDGATFQDNHQVCTQDGVHTVLVGAGGGWSGWGGVAKKGQLRVFLWQFGRGGMWMECPISVATAFSWGDCDSNPLSTNDTLFP